MNKKKLTKLAALAAALILLVGLAVFANAMVGNPVSKLVVTRAAKARLEAAYPDYELQSVSYSFKDGYYYARAAVPGSLDRHFSLYYDGTGRLRREGASDVTDGWNTAMRLDEAYRSLVRGLLDGSDFPYETDICYGSLETVPRRYVGSSDAPDWAIIQEELELDKEYDLAELGAKAGRLTVYILTEEELSPAFAAEALLELRARMDSAGARFYAVDLVLRHPKDPETSAWRSGSLRLDAFLYSDITEPGLTEKVTALARIEE